MSNNKVNNIFIFHREQIKDNHISLLYPLHCYQYLLPNGHIYCPSVWHCPIYLTIFRAPLSCVPHYTSCIPIFLEFLILPNTSIISDYFCPTIALSSHHRHLESIDTCIPNDVLLHLFHC